MKIKKQIEMGVDIHNPIHLYIDDTLLLRILIDRFQGKCYRSCYIESVDEILRRGECVINQDGSPSFGTISVVFEVTAVVFVTGEVVNGCKVVRKDKNGIIICATELADIMLKTHQLLESVKVGQLISVIVGGVKYHPGADKVSVNAIPFTFSEPKAYKIGPMTPETKSLLANVLTRVRTEEAARDTMKKTHAKAWDTFSKLLYAYKKDPGVPPGAKLINILDETAMASVQYICRDPRIDLSTPVALGYDTESFPPETQFFPEVTVPNAYLVIFENYYAHLKMIREMVEIYSTQELLMSHQNLWQIISKLKF